MPDKTNLLKTFLKGLETMDKEQEVKQIIEEFVDKLKNFLARVEEEAKKQGTID